MKKYLIIAGVLISFLSSCSKSELMPENAVSGTKLFYAEVPSDDTRTYMDGDYEIHWTEDDRISVFCSPANEQYRFTGGTGAQRGTFESLTDPVTPIYGRNYAIYPYQSVNTSSDEGTINITIPSVQTYEEKSFGLGANTMAAVTDDIQDDTFRFRNVCGYLMLKLYGGDRIKRITLRGNDGEKIAGAATITAGYSADPAIAMDETATTEITLDCPSEGIPTNKSEESFTQFWIVVPPTTFTKGFTVEITNTDDDVVTRSTDKSVTIHRNKILKMAPVQVDTQNAHELLSFSLSDGVHEYKAFDISDGYVNVQVPDGTDMTNMTATFTYNGESVKVNDIPQTSGADSHDFSDFVNPLTYVVTSRSGISQSYEIRMFNLPIVFATTPNGKAITSKTVWTEGCTFKIREADGTSTDFGTTSLKGRGNYSWAQYSKKPYAVKFNQKSTVLGMPSGKRWCLLNNDPGSYYSNLIGFGIARRTASIKWSPSGKQIELFLNGKHQGVYLLCEQIKVDKNRVDITEMSSSDVEGDNITGGYLLTYDTSFDEVNKFRSQYFNMPVMFKDPDDDVLVQAQFDYLKDYINNFEASLKDNTRFASREYLNYFDIDSYIDVWFVWEMAGGITFNGNDHYSDFVQPRSVYFYKDRNDVLRAGPVWDFNSCLFNRQRIICNNCQYYGRLFQDPFFVARVKEKWPEFRRRVLDNDGQHESILLELEEIHSGWQAFQRDIQMNWAPRSVTKENEHYTTIRDGIVPKLDFLESYINSLKVNYDSLPGGNEDVDSQDDKTGDFDFKF